MWDKIRSVLIVSILVFSGFVLFFNFGVDDVCVDAVNRYVGPTSTYKTINSAIENATAGDTIYVDNGTYVESVLVNKVNIKLIGNSSTNCIIQHHFNGVSPNYAAGINVTADGVKISGFNISVSGDRSFAIFSDSNNNIDLLNNTIHTTGQWGHGIYARYSSDHDIINNTINTSNFLASAIYLDNSDYFNIIDNKINNSGVHGYGFRLEDSDNNNITYNAMVTSGNNAYGFQVFRSSYNNITNNKITTSGNAAYGFYIEYFSEQDNILNNTINTSGSDGFGFYMSQGSKLNIYNNTITTENQFGYGFQIQLSDEVNITYNRITTSGSNAIGIYFSQSENNTLFNNVINTSGFNGYGIWITSDTDNCSLKDNIVNTTGGNSAGIYLSDSNNTNVTNNNVNVLDGFGIFLNEASYNRVENNTIKIKGFQDDGIQLDYYSDYNDLIGNRINATGQFGRGIKMEVSSNYTTIIANTINTSGPGGDAIRIENSNNTTILNCNFNVTGSSAMGIYLDGNVATVFDSEFISTNDFDIYIANSGNLTVIKSDFTDVDVEQDGGGVLQVGNYLSLQAYYEDTITPIQDADVSIDDNGYALYSTSGYGGIDPVTDASGQINNIIVIDRWYFYSNSPTENVTTVKVKKTLNTTWEEQRDVNMSTSHTEIFVATDMMIPTRPTGFMAGSVPDGDAMNVSWDLNADDTEKYELWWRSSESSAWVKLGNFTNTTSWFVWENDNLVNGTYHHFRLRAWDDNKNPSNFTNVINVTHRDNELPEVPTNLVAASISETRIDLSWSASIATDVEEYWIYLNYPTSGTGGPYEKLTEVNAQTSDYQVTGLSENVTYYFVIVAFDEGKNPSGNSNEANSTTLAVKPTKPVLDPLPKITNIFDWNVTGTAEIGVTIYIYNNDENEDVANGTPNATGVFGFDVTLIEGINKISARAMDQANLWSLPSLYQIVILNTTKPVADAGIHNNISTGSTHKFDGTNSTDDDKIDNYTWTFVYDGKNITLYGPEPEFKFDIPDTYTVTLTVTDNAGNKDTDTTTVHVSEAIEKDIITPDADAGTDQQKKVGEKVSFDGSGSSDNVGISNYTWTFKHNNTDVILYGEKPSFEFEYPGEYEVTLTVIDLTVPPNKDTDTVWINVSMDIVDTDLDDDGIPNWWEDQHGFNKTDANDAALDADDDDLTNLNEFMKETDPHDPDSDDDGLTDGWEVDYKLDPLDNSTNNGALGDPDEDGYTNLEEFEAKTDPLDKKDNPGADEPDDKETDNTMMYLAIIIIIIIILLLIIVMAMRKKKPAEEEEELEKEEEGAEEFEETECPECGAMVPGVETECPECGSKMPDKEESEVEEEEGDTFECPDCGADLAAGESVCPECGAEFEEDEDEDIPTEEEIPDEELKDELNEDAESDEDIEDELEE